MNFSRKKIRGYKRKIRKLNNWKEYIINYPFENVENSIRIFRVYLRPFFWYRDLSPPFKFLPHILSAYQEIFEKLKSNKAIKDKNFSIQICIFYPRVVKSLVVVATEENINTIKKKMSVGPIRNNIPKIIYSYFPESTFKQGTEYIFHSDNPESEHPKWNKIKKGDIWIIE